MLQDRARIFVSAGAGGAGSVSFRREAHVPRGGPDGGDGGRGADVVLLCSGSLRDLRGLRRRTHYRAAGGEQGAGALRHGASGDPLVIAVPPGTQARGVAGDLEGRAWDLVRDGSRVVLARGGTGGRGNKRFAGPARQAPRFAERGLAGEQGWVELALKLLADVGLVGLPNAGKSSLLARLTRAEPKVAPYPFTTLEPVLGVLGDDERQVVIADIPGLIEGASEGAGLGDEFLAHVERTSVLVHVLDCAPELSAAEASLRSSFETIERELTLYDPRLALLPRILALSKVDLLAPERLAPVIAQARALVGADVPVIATSSATGAGLDELAAELLRMVPAAAADRAIGGGERSEEQGERAPEEEREDGEEDGLAEHMLFRPQGHEGFHVERAADGRLAVAGPAVARLVERFDLANDEARAYVEARLQRLGVLGALRGKGFQPGEAVLIDGVELRLGDPHGPRRGRRH